MKRKLLLAMLCIVSALVFKANAQKDVTSQYITNAKLSSLTGWTVSNFNTPVNGYSVKDDKDPKHWSNATEGYATEAYAGWDQLSVTSYSLKQNITLPAGNYTLVCYAFFRQGQNHDTNVGKSLAFLKAGENQVAIKTLGSITVSGYANSQWEGADCFDSKMYRNTLDFTIAADNTTIEIGLTGTFDEMRSWCILGMFELIDNDTPATMDAPFDVTGYITNAGFEYRDMTGWTLSGDGAIGVQNNNQGFKSGWYYAEKWQPSASGALTARSMSQTLTDLPAGYYKLTANLGGSGTYIDLNGKKANWTEDKNYTVGYVLAENEDLTITAGKTAEGTANWIHFDNFKLQFCGDVAAALTSLLNTAKDLLDNAKMNSSVKSALQTAYDTYNQTYSDVDELLAAIAAMQEAITPAQSSAAVYNNISTAISTYATKAAALDAAGQAAYDASGVQTKYDNGTYVTLSEAESELQAAYTSAVKSQSEDSDWTDLITNPSFETGNFNGWTNDGMATQNNNSFDGKVGTYYAEAWQPNGTKSVRQTISELPVGIYSIKAKAYARGVTSAKLIADMSKKSITVEAAAAEYTLEFLLHSAGDLTFGFEGVGTGAGSSWLCVDDFSMKFVRAATDDDYVALFNSLKDEATELLDSEPNITGIERTNVNNAIAATPSTRDEYITASEALNTAINNFKAVKGSYDTYAAAKAVNYPDNKPYASAEKYAAITTAQAAGDATSASDAEAKTAAIISAYRKYVESNALAEGINGGNKTSLISDSNFAGVSIDTGNKKAGAWSYTQDGGNPGILNSESFTDGEGNNNYNYFDYWNGDNNNQHLTQTISNLLAGKYLLTVTARADATFNNYFYLKVTEDNVIENIPAIGNSGGTFNRGWNDVSLEFTHANNGDVTIEVYSDGGSGENKRSGWWGATRFRLAQIGEVVTISAAGWATLYTPYALDFSGISGLTAYTATVENSTVTLNEVSDVPANTGVVLKGNADTYNIPVIASSETAKGDLRGNATEATAYDAIANTTLYILGKNGEGDAQFFPTNAGSIEAGKAYLPVANSSAKALRVVVNGEATEVTAPEVAETEEEEILFNMAGVQVDKNFKGFVINQKGEKRFNR